MNLIKMLVNFGRGTPVTKSHLVFIIHSTSQRNQRVNDIGSMVYCVMVFHIFLKMFNLIFVCISVHHPIVFLPARMELYPTFLSGRSLGNRVRARSRSWVMIMSLGGCVRAVRTRCIPVTDTAQASFHIKVIVINMKASV